MSEFVFVYGTLKRGGACEEVLLHSGGRYVCDAEVSGVELYLLPAGFPAAVIGPGVAKGEIWSTTVLWGLDQLEGNGRLYQREPIQFDTSEGEITAWIYLYLNGLPQSAMPLVTGHYPIEDGEAENLLFEWAYYHGWKTPFGCNGFEVYVKDDPQCYMDCVDCPYNYNGGCEFSDEFSLDIE